MNRIRYNQVAVRIELEKQRIFSRIESWQKHIEIERNKPYTQSFMYGSEAEYQKMIKNAENYLKWLKKIYKQIICKLYKNL